MLIVELTIASITGNQCISSPAVEGLPPQEVQRCGQFEHDPTVSSIIEVDDTQLIVVLEDNLGSADVHLSPEQITLLDSVSRVSLGFPHDMLGAGYGSDRFGKPAVPVT